MFSRSSSDEDGGAGDDDDAWFAFMVGGGVSARTAVEEEGKGGGEGYHGYSCWWWCLFVLEAGWRPGGESRRDEKGKEDPGEGEIPATWTLSGGAVRGTRGNKTWGREWGGEGRERGGGGVERVRQAVGEEGCVIGNVKGGDPNGGRSVFSSSCPSSSSFGSRTRGEG